MTMRYFYILGALILAFMIAMYSNSLAEPFQGWRVFSGRLHK